MTELAGASSGPPLINLLFLHLPDGNLIYRPIMDLIRYQIVTASLQVVKFFWVQSMRLASGAQ